MSSVYFDSKVQLEAGASVTATAWHPSIPILAVATSDGAIRVLNEEGEAIEGAVLRKSGQAQSLLWLPNVKILLIGWTNGSITTWNYIEKQSRDDNQHTSGITQMIASADGSRMVSGDRNGCVNVWKCDNNGLVQGISQYRKGTSPVMFIVLRTVSQCEFVYADEAGVVRVGNDKNQLLDGFELGDTPATLLYDSESDTVVSATRGAVLAIHRFASQEGSALVQDSKVRLAAAASSGGILGGSWVGPSMLATCALENVVRVVNVATDDTFALTIIPRSVSNKASATAKPSAERLVCIAYNPDKHCLAAGTMEGRIVVWQAVDASAKNWHMTTAYESPSPVVNIAWGPGVNGLVVATLQDSMVVLSEAQMARKVVGGVAAIQVGADKIVLERHGSKARTSIPCNMRVISLDHDGKRMVVSSGKKISVYRIGGEGDMIAAEQQNTFLADGAAVAVFGETVFVAEKDLIKVYNVAGVVKYSITLPQSDGRPIRLDTAGNFLAASTDNNMIRVWDVSRREAKQTAPGHVFDLGEILSIRISPTGTMVSVISQRRTQAPGGVIVRSPETKLHCYDTESDVFHAYDFVNRTPVAHYWDETEPRLLTCSIRPLNAATATESFDEGAHAEGIEIATMFVTSDMGIKLQDTVALPADSNGLIGIRVPYLYLEGRVNEESTNQHILREKVMRDFVGMESVDDAARDALLKFSFYLTVGNMDEAYKAVKLIKSTHVWENMAHMCVKTRRLDVAEMCLGNMGHVRGAAMLRESKEEVAEPEAHLAMVAIQLGMLDDAEKLYTECKRYDLLSRMLQSCGKWERAIQIAEQHDRIHLRNTHFNFAKYLEANGDFAGAIRHYEIADVHRAEVPRMFNDRGREQELQAYVFSQNDKALFKWYAEFLESRGMHDQCIQAYQKADDLVSVIRCLVVYQQDVARATKICQDTDNPSACYHLARFYEHQDPPRIKEAMEFYTKSGRVNHAIRIAKDNDMPHELLQLSMQADPQYLVDVARWMEDRGVMDKAVILYSKGGDVNAAVELCFRAGLFEELKSIAGDLGPNTDPELLRKCAEFFAQNGQMDKAVQMLIHSGQTLEALDLCIQRNVNITDDMAEGMTPAKQPQEDEQQAAHRIRILLKIASCAKRQGNLHLACKKYTQAGEKVKAIKALLKSGDTEKIMVFASVARQKEIYILAANYLQTMDWRGDSEIMKNIIAFYTKAKSFDSLSDFYDACAQVEIDEFRDYDKALVALRESMTHLKKARVSDMDEKLRILGQKISPSDADTVVSYVERFVAARNAVKTDASEMVKVCMSLLQELDDQSAVRVGDVFALLIEYYYAQANFQQAFQYIEKMRSRRILLGPYLDQEMVQNIYTQLGLPLDLDEEELVDEEIEG